MDLIFIFFNWTFYFPWLPSQEFYLLSSCSAFHPAHSQSTLLFDLRLWVFDVHSPRGSERRRKCVPLEGCSQEEVEIKRCKVYWRVTTVMWTTCKKAHLLVSLLVIGVFTTSWLPTGGVSVCLVQVVREQKIRGWRAWREREVRGGDVQQQIRGENERMK